MERKAGRKRCHLIVLLSRRWRGSRRNRVDVRTRSIGVAVARTRDQDVLLSRCTRPIDKSSMLALLHHARPSSYCISHGPMKWRNLISYRDRLYTSKANIDVFELWAIWFVITKWKLEIGDPAWLRRLLIKFVQSSVYVPFDRWNKCFLSSLSSPLDISSPEDAYRLFYIFHYTVHRSCLTLLIFQNMDPRTDYIFHRTVHHRSCLTYSRMRIFGRIAFSVSLFIFFITLNHISCLILVTLIDSFRFVAIKTRILSKPARNVSSR